MHLFKTLESFFGSSTITVISDSEVFAKRAESVGFSTELVSRIKALPAHGVALCFTREGTEALMALAARQGPTRTLFAQPHAFDPCLETGLYSLGLVACSDIAQALDKQREVLLLLDEHDDLELSGGGADARVRILPDAAPYAMIAEDIQLDFVHPLAELFEVHFAHMNRDEPCPFSVEGRLEVAGILTVRRAYDDSLSPLLIQALADMRQRVARYGATAHIQDNQLQSLTCGGLDYAHLLRDAVGPRGLALTEFAFGVNACIGERVDYRLNSPMNEGVEGIHIAVGDGVHGYHLDLLCPGVVAAPYPANR